ncbi:MAG TPA: hypothetical protein VKV20_02830 [Ktedonobacteraceae bacterium]|nr:hypothetical protein [Ktedonobacteraceae bacterium]
MNQLQVFTGASGYEFRMQIRRRSMWVAFIAMGLIFTQFHQPWNRSITTPARDATVYWTAIAQTFLAVAAGIFLADRSQRDRRTRVDEVLNALPGGLSARLCGKYFGSVLATLVPLLLVYGAGVIYILARWHTMQELPIALAAFATIALPGLLFVAAFSIACPAFLWLPLYQFLFIGYWFWGNLLPDVGIPTLSTTILTPIGGYMCTGFFNPMGKEGVCNPGIQGATAIQGIESMLLLIAISILVLLLLWLGLRFYQARQ